MSGRKSPIIFDTSGLNALVDETESHLIQRALAIGFRVRLTETNVCEVAATKDSDRRMQLLKLCRHLIFAGESINPYNEILQLLSRAHAANRRMFDWRTVDVRSPELEEEIARPTFLGTQELADEVRRDNRLSNRQFQEMWQDARAKFSAELREQGPISVDKVFEALADVNSPMWRLAGSIYKTTTGIALEAAEARAFIEACPPAKAMLYANCVGQYQWGVKNTNETSLYRAGRLDVFAAAYLPYCERFVTRDLGQYEALKLVANRAGLATEVCTYADFRRGLLLAA